MKVEIDIKSGFCFGVRNAVEIAEKALRDGEKVFSLGPIVHNDKEVERLASLGLVSINHDQFRKLKNCKVLIRAHGEPPETYSTAEKNNITIVEATCPIVKKMQSGIKDTWEKYKMNNGQIVIYGKPGHAEVIGLLGQTDNQGILISNSSDTDKIDFSRPVALFCQTTMELNDFNSVKELIYNKMKEQGVLDPDHNLVVKSTVCGQVSNREPHLKVFAREHDVIIFVSGKESSNGRMLYAVCKSVNPDTHLVSSSEEIEKSWFDGKRSVGICGATSTPRWLIENIKDFVLTL
ncbi:MAG TPA: 4-hydroxy-3-methylbut-2-enyl diphosphate reductase [Bacteroidales bacterium]|jgi:4-hydroxy-3-methylbut-2-en-1-yl diphosphate reductase|nr:4-hydroxy-3-methylbut-2-enyl diphosphate reductase [Bacteroidales bacterium]HBZ21421.1 4-hydroxy-3-methylbut-2-enyl diphosphate reductase [Bacteroidales bacterium]